MAKYVPKIYPDILQRMINRVVARTALSDLTDSSVFKHILAAVAREVDDAYFQMNNKLDVFSIDRASGEDLDRRAEDYGGIIGARQQAIAATGNVTFSRATANPGPDIVIPIGTEVEVPGESPAIVAATTAVGTILTGNTDTGNVAAVITASGVRGNVASGTLTKFKSAKPSGVDTVTNLSAFVGGVDKETDDAYRQRIKEAVTGLPRSTVSALEAAARTVELGTGQRIVFSRVVENPINLGLVSLYVDDGSGSVETTATITGEILTSGPEFPGDVAQGGEEFLYTDQIAVKDTVTINLVKNPGATTLIRDDPGADGYTINPASGQIFLQTALLAGDDVTADYTHFTGILQETQKVIDGDATDRDNYPGYRAAGVLVKVLPPSIVNVTVNAGITVLNGFTQTDVAAQVRTAIASYINELGIGNDVIVSEIIERSMAVPGMFDILISQPLSNIVILDDQLPRVNNAAQDITIG